MRLRQAPEGADIRAVAIQDFLEGRRIGLDELIEVQGLHRFPAGGQMRGGKQIGQAIGRVLFHRRRNQRPAGGPQREAEQESGGERQQQGAQRKQRGRYRFLGKHHRRGGEQTDAKNIKENPHA